MSLPIPTTTATSGTTATQQQQQLYYDEGMEHLFIELAQRSQGDLRKLLTSFFSFLYRRTDFYCIVDDTNPKSSSSNAAAGTTATTVQSQRKMGFQNGEAEKIMIAAFRQFPLRRISSSSATTPPAAATAAAASASVSPSNPVVPTYPQKLQPPTSTTNKDPEKEKTKTSMNQTASSDHSLVKKSSISTTTNTLSTNVHYTEEGLQIPIGNGGIVPNQYQWTQTLEECTVYIPLRLNEVNNSNEQQKQLRGKDLNIIIEPTKLLVQIKQQQTQDASNSETSSSDNSYSSLYPNGIVLEGELSQRVVPSESTWTIESNMIQIILYKHVKTFWDSIVSVHDNYKIDTSLIDSRRNINTYDEMTQSQIRKIIFDQQQYHLGLPSSDELIGTKPVIPPLPTGVEYIDQSIIDSKMKELGK